MNTKILEIKNLTKIYNNKTVALDNISLDIYQGETLSLLGVNGAGKTTLSSILATIHPPTSGEVLFKGQSIYRNIMGYRSKLGFCPQTPNLDPYLNVKDNLIFTGKYFLLSPNEIQERTAKLMKQFGLEKYASFKVSELSGGWQRRLLIARALMARPEIIILDEPTVGLDPDIRRHLWHIINELKKEGVTIILTTHYLDEAEVLSDRACILHKGSIILTERISELKGRHKEASLEEVFISITTEPEKDIL